MKARAPRGRWLCAMLLVGLVAQVAAAATHSIHPDAIHEQPADGDEHGRHDPGSCSFCRIAHAFEQGLSVSPLSVPIGTLAIRHRFAVIPAMPGQAPWARPASRAPPCATSA